MLLHADILPQKFLHYIRENGFEHHVAADFSKVGSCGT